MFSKLIINLALLLLPIAGTACSNDHSSSKPTAAPTEQPAQDTASTVLFIPPVPDKPTGTAWIVISKRNQTLSVYDRNAAGDTVIVAQFPCCMGKNKGDKVKRGDMRTPESPAGKPFKITMIQDASTWKHDFKDGRGNILA